MLHLVMIWSSYFDNRYYGDISLFAQQSPTNESVDLEIGYTQGVAMYVIRFYITQTQAIVTDAMEIAGSKLKWSTTRSRRILRMRSITSSLFPVAVLWKHSPSS